MPKKAVVTDVVVEAGDWPAAASLRRMTRRAVDAAADRTALALAPDSEVCVVFTDDAHIRNLNGQFRGKARPTNVLSFPAAPPLAGRYGPLLGDIVLSSETVEKEAAAGGLSLADHATHLIVHGFLHLVGYDHVDDDEAEVMERLETTILAGLGISDPYAAGDGAAHK